MKLRAFLFGSLVRIHETRQLNFTFPLSLPGFLRKREEGFDQPSRTYESRGFLKFDESTETHHLTEEMQVLFEYFSLLIRANPAEVE